MTPSVSSLSIAHQALSQLLALLRCIAAFLPCNPQGNREELPAMATGCSALPMASKGGTVPLGSVRVWCANHRSKTPLAAPKALEKVPGRCQRESHIRGEPHIKMFEKNQVANLKGTSKGKVRLTSWLATPFVDERLNPPRISTAKAFPLDFFSRCCSRS